MVRRDSCRVVASGSRATLFAPATVSDRSDGKIAHLDGLNLSRAWCWRSSVVGWSADDPRRSMWRSRPPTCISTASLPHVAGDYAGEHWLATYALLAIMAEERGQVARHPEASPARHRKASPGSVIAEASPGASS